MEGSNNMTTKITDKTIACYFYTKGYKIVNVLTDGRINGKTRKTYYFEYSPELGETYARLNSGIALTADEDFLLNFKKAFKVISNWE